MLEPHPIANIFPLMDDVAFTEFQADIKQHTLQDSTIWLYDGKILDGRNRYRACEALHIPYKTELYTGDDPLAFVVSRNLHRRHLKEGQRAMVGDKIANLLPGGQEGNTNQSAQAISTRNHTHHEDANLHVGKESSTKEKKPRPQGNSSKPERVTREKAADLVNVSTRSIADAHKVHAEADPAVIAAVESGKVAVSAGAKLADSPVKVQREVIKKVTQGEAKTVQQAMKQVAVENGYQAPGPDIFEDLKTLRHLWEKMMKRWTTEADRGKIYDNLTSLAQSTIEGQSL